MIRFAQRIKQRYINRNTGIQLYRKLENLFKENPEINALFPYEAFGKHYVYEPSRQTIDHPDIYINQIRYYRLYEFFQHNYPEMFSDQISIADVGDTSGLLFKAMKRRGLSVNINTDVVEFIKSMSIEAEVGDIENLPFENKSFDYTFSFQCLEHLCNPIRALTELSRITRKNAFISIPFVAKTKIYDKNYWLQLKRKSFQEGGWNEREVREVDGHKFEFSTIDFKKIISYAHFIGVDNFPLNYFSPLGKNRINEGSYFNFFILKPV